ncbi:glutathione-dependent formaldehyde dehydrogenase [Oscillospiraceae bacterium]|nr:glutathione-dependent formaldehyde dehydrogenase [Oscillospiraceae bacterium]BDF75815.1 glutathione-dependent formaldehyde dehydrogenase [Oscillospiraceae bacterium]
MKAVVYQGIRDVAVQKVADPSIEQDDDIIVKVTSTAICGSDLHLIHGTVTGMYPGYVLGHETMGIVEEAGKGVTKVKKGDRVVVPFPVACGHCAFCEAGEFSQCDNSNPNGEAGGLLGYSKNFGDYAGGQAEYLRVPYANVGPVVVPEGLTDEQVLFTTDILPTSRWGVEQGGVKRGDTVVVLGCGPVGLLTMKWALYEGAQRVIAVDNVGYRLEHAAGYPGVETVNFEDHDNTGLYLKELTHGGADVVIDCVGMDGKMSAMEKVETALKLQAGSKAAIEMSSEAVRKCGTVVMLGVYGGRYNLFPLGNFFSRNVTLKMGQCPAQRYAKPILDLIAQGRFDATDIITHTLSLDEGARGYEVFDKKQEGCIKVVLKP